MTNSVLEPAVAHDTQLVTHEVTTAPPGETQFERYDTIDTPKIVVVGFVAAILTFVVVVAAQAMFFMAADAEHVRKSLNVTDTSVEQVITQQQGRLADYRWIDSQTGVVSIPIEDAMRAVVADEKSKQAAGESDAR